MASFYELDGYKPMSRNEVHKLIEGLPTARDRETAQRIVERTHRVVGVMHDKLHDATQSPQLDRDRYRTIELWERMQTRDLERLRQSADLRFMRDTGREAATADKPRTETLAPPERKFDERLMGNLAHVEPLREGELEQLYASLSRKSDQDGFTAIVKEYEARDAEAGLFARDIDREASGIWEFGKEFERRRLARDLRRFVERARERDGRISGRTRERRD